MYLDPNKYNVFCGEEKLLLNGKALDYSMLNFWQLSLSDILFNMTRGTFAEFIVRCALREGGFDAFTEPNGTIKAWDITGPEIRGLGYNARIEVKSAASVQANTPNEKEPISLPDANLHFGIAKAIDWEKSEESSQRNNDLYVFCHYKATHKTDNMLDLSFWEFYVFPTYKIDENNNLKDKNSISLYRLKKIIGRREGIPFSDLYACIMDTIEDISKHDFK